MINTNANVYFSHEEFKKNIMTLTSDIVWKDRTAAAEAVHAESAYLSEVFEMAVRSLLNFNIIRAFPRVILQNALIDPDLIEIYAADKTKIPEAMRDSLVARYQSALLERHPQTGRYMYHDVLNSRYVEIYHEYNNYYRMLMGLPDEGDYNYVYNTDFRWSQTVPIHDMTYVDRLDMEEAGILDELYKLNPTKKYIKFLGKKNIPFADSRLANRFDILYMSAAPNSEIYSAFLREYSKAKYLVNSVYYSNAFKIGSDKYDNFLAMSILFITVQSMMNQYLEADIGRNFFDIESLKIVYDSYSVPFYSEIPMSYHQKIVKRINKLISYKGSSIVFLDLFEIFNLGSMEIFSYYITKTHKVDSRGVPIFTLTTDDEGNIIYDSDGNPVLDKSVYEIAFSTAGIFEDPSLAIADIANKKEYGSVVDKDPYWINDQELLDKLSDEQFNFLESKYLNINTIIDLMKVTYESAYIFRLITDNKELTKYLRFRWNAFNVEGDIYSAFIYLATLYCRYFGYEGMISDKFDDIIYTLGYNYEEAASIYTNQILTDEFLSKNTALRNKIAEMGITDMASVNENLEDIYDLQKIISDGYINAKTVKEFNAYKELYNTLLISTEVKEVYTNPDTGMLYETFEEILQNQSPYLYSRMLSIIDGETDPDAIKTKLAPEVDIVIDQLNILIESLQYLPLSVGIDSGNLIKSLYNLIDFFKSAKAEISDYDISYIIAKRNDNFFKMLDAINRIYMTTSGESIHIFLDSIKAYGEIVKIRDKFQYLIDELVSATMVVHFEKELQLYNDMIKYIREQLIMHYYSTQPLIDFIEVFKMVVRLPSSYQVAADGIVYTDAWRIIIDERLQDDYILTLIDELVHAHEIFSMKDVLDIVDKLIMIDHSIVDHYKSDFSMVDFISNTSTQSMKYYEYTMMMVEEMLVTVITSKTEDSFSMDDYIKAAIELSIISNDDVTYFDNIGDVSEKILQKQVQIYTEKFLRIPYRFKLKDDRVISDRMRTYTLPNEERIDESFRILDTNIISTEALSVDNDDFIYSDRLVVLSEVKDPDFD